jgi:hypothetical protein
VRAGSDDEGGRDNKGGWRQRGWAMTTRAGGNDDEGAVGIIYTFNRIILAFEFFYLLSCGLVMACRPK